MLADPKKLRILKKHRAAFMPGRFRWLDERRRRISAAFATSEAIDFYVRGGEVCKIRLSVSKENCLNVDEYLNGGVILFRHDSAIPVGVPEALSFDESLGIGRVVFRLARNPAADNCLKLMKCGLIRGLSVAFFNVENKFSLEAKETTITKWILDEISLANSPRDIRCLFRSNGQPVSKSFDPAKMEGYERETIELVRLAREPIPLATSFIKKRLHPRQIALELVGRLAAERERLKGLLAEKKGCCHVRNDEKTHCGRNCGACCKARE